MNSNTALILVNVCVVGLAIPPHNWAFGVASAIWAIVYLRCKD